MKFLRAPALRSGCFVLVAFGDCLRRRTSSWVVSLNSSPKYFRRVRSPNSPRWLWRSQRQAFQSIRQRERVRFLPLIPWWNLQSCEAERAWLKIGVRWSFSVRCLRYGKVASCTR